MGSEDLAALAAGPLNALGVGWVRVNLLVPLQVSVVACAIWWAFWLWDTCLVQVAQHELVTAGGPE
jgi:hypothetical protein